MARVVLLSARAAEDETPEHRRPLEALQESALADKFHLHQLTDNAESADAIIFVESYGAGWHFERVRRHPLTNHHREKCFIVSSNPFVIPFLPGLYTAIGRRWASRRVAPGLYLGQTVNEFLTYTPPSPDLPYLFSFMGSTKTAPVRREVARLTHPRSFFLNTAASYERALHRQMPASEWRDYYHRYAEHIRSSKFVLCPRGLSVSSLRLFETMEMGRVPVIISDDWKTPAGPCWDRFCLRVAETDVAQIPRLLSEREAEAVTMGELARAQWQDWYSKEAAFHRVVEWCLALKKERRVPENVARWPVYLQYLRPFHFRRALGNKVRHWRSRRGVPLQKPAPAAKSSTLRKESP
ncbi:MAG: exostosin family protein [Chthoniobacterales bacterium]